MRLRAPERAELAALSALCLRSKAVHGYPEAMVAAFRAELTLTPADLEADALVVAEDASGIFGLVQVSAEGDDASLEKLFIAPERIGTGAGRVLFDWACGAARARGARRLVIESDPGAAGFYEAMGAVRDGEAPSGSVPGRHLPRLVLAL